MRKRRLRDMKWVAQSPIAVSGQLGMWNWGTEIKEFVQGQVDSREGSNSSLQTSIAYANDKQAAYASGLPLQAALKFFPHGNPRNRIWRKEELEYSYSALSVSCRLKKLLRWKANSSLWLCWALMARALESKLWNQTWIPNSILHYPPASDMILGNSLDLHFCIALKAILQRFTWQWLCKDTYRHTLEIPCAQFCSKINISIKGVTHLGVFKCI